LGVLLGIIAGCGYGANWFITPRATPREPGLFVQPLTWATASATGATVALSPISGGMELPGIAVRSWILLVLLAVIGQVIAWLFVHHGSALLSSTTTGGLLLIQPILALGLSAAILSENPTGLQLVGVAVVVVSVAVANGLLCRNRTRRHIHRPSGDRTC